MASFLPFAKSSKLMQKSFEEALGILNPHVLCIISNGFLGWTLESPQKFNVPRSSWVISGLGEVYGKNTRILSLFLDMGSLSILYSTFFMVFDSPDRASSGHIYEPFPFGSSKFTGQLSFFMAFFLHFTMWGFLMETTVVVGITSLGIALSIGILMVLLNMGSVRSLQSEVDSHFSSGRTHALEICSLAVDRLSRAMELLFWIVIDQILFGKQLAR
ncbi:hypothetical protein BUALT_BualtUnG0001700 [Buddleja alternifolia]|uniref:Uncharacterized protein n=1 Tax=Buddleja alternifolia TaxID=168488 RepID=A0AAV6W0V3_9LAMI|nr:hypothetical protein BUALT_BualtUnG0001700 [Buddleja alternifolia]